MPPTPILTNAQSLALNRAVAPLPLYGLYAAAPALISFDGHCYRATYTKPDLTKVLKCGVMEFVDDNNAQTTGRPNISEEALALYCTRDAQLWHDIMWATGGALETYKCSY